MSRSNDRPQTSDMDVLTYAEQIGDEYGCRVRLSVVPLSRPSGKSTHAVEVRAYTLQGRVLAEVEREQCLFPGGTSKTIHGAWVYLLGRLAGTLDEYAARKRREEEQWEPGVLTPLEQYIAGNFES